MMKERKIIGILFWTARIIAICILGITLIFLIGSLIEGRDKPPANFDNYTIITFVVWGIGLIGLLTAIWKSGIGGLISLVCFVSFNLLVALNPKPDSKYPILLLLFIFPSVLFLISWWLKKSIRK